MGKKPDGTPYVEYYLTMHLSFCRGPVDRWSGLEVKDKQLFEDDERYTENTKISVNEPDLFGGHLREGGLVGDVYFMNGSGGQKSPQAMADRVSLTPDTMPGYRGIVSLFLCGNDNSGAKGFAVGCNTPQVPSIYGRFARASRQLENNVAIVPSFEGEWHDSNAANIIYECLVHKDLMNGAESQIDIPAMNYAAQVLHDEEFGMSLLWNATGSIESFVQEVLEHINGVIYFNPYTGKLVLKLLRDDYDPNALPELGPDNCFVKTFRRPLWGETINEIVLTYTDARNEETRSVTYQDLGNIAMQGSVVSETRDMRGIRSRKLANKVCARELRVASTPLASATIETNRSVRKADGTPYLPGDVFKLTYPLHNISTLVMRVLEVDWGTVDDSKITMKCVEDVFGLDYAEWKTPPDTTWEPPGKDPDDPLFDTVEYLFRATPASLVRTRAPVRASDRDDFLNDDLYNQIAINTYILPTDAQFDLNHYIAYRPSVNSLGEEEFVSVGEKRPVGHTSLAESIGQAVKTNIMINPMIGPGDWPKKGFLGMFIGEDEFTDELFVFEEYLGEGQWRVRRGVLDTIPALGWPKDTRIIVHSNSYDGYDWSTRFAEHAERYKFRFRTSEGLGSFTNEVTTQRPPRPYLPYRPANVKIETTMFGKEDQSQKLVPDDYDMFKKEHVPRDWVLRCSWSRRNRNAEDQVWLAWDDPDVPPETGQTTEIIILAGDEEVDRITGLTGTFYDLDLIEHTARYTKLKLKFVSRRPHPDVPEGLESLQGITIDLELYMKGYGSDWDYLWGGWPEGTVLTEIEDVELMGRLPTAAAIVESD